MDNIESNQTRKADSDELARKIVAVLVEKKAIDVRLYRVGENSSVTDCYINATGRSSTNVASLADDVTYNTELIGRRELRVEGRMGNSWLLIDYGDVIVNIFDKASREFYDFDRLLPEGARVDISDIVEEVDKKFDINNKKED